MCICICMYTFITYIHVYIQYVYIYIYVYTYIYIYIYIIHIYIFISIYTLIIFVENIHCPTYLHSINLNRSIYRHMKCNIHAKQITQTAYKRDLQNRPTKETYKRDL